MSRKGIVAAVVGVLLVAAIATFAIVSAVGTDDDDDDLNVRVAELEERVGELEGRLRGPGFGFGERRPDEPGPEDLLGELFRRFEGGSPEDLFGEGRPPADLLDELIQGLFGDDLTFDFDFGEGFEPDEDFFDGLQERGFLDENEIDELRDVFDMLREVLEGAGDN